MAQNVLLKQLHEKTEGQLNEIIKGSSSLTGFMAIDLTSGDSFSYNAEMVFPQGSAIKIPVLMELYKQAWQKKLTLTDLRVVEKKDLVAGTGVLQTMVDPVSLSLRNLGILMIVLSDNSATNTLLGLVGLENINHTMNTLGLKDTRVQRRMIDPQASGKGEENVSTPAEAIKILKCLYEGKFCSSAVSSEIISILRKNDRGNSRLGAGIPTSVPLAFKPGELDGVSTEWAIVYLKERPYAIAIMQNYRIREEKDEVMEHISKVLYNYYWRVGNSSRFGTYVNPEFIK